MVSNHACSPFSALMTQVSTVERASMSSAEFMNILGTEVERMLREIHSVRFIRDSLQQTHSLSHSLLGHGPGLGAELEGVARLAVNLVVRPCKSEKEMGEEE